MSSAAFPPLSHAAESARYALLRRLAPSMRHHLVVNLQPIGMVYEIMERRLRAPSPQLAEVQEGAHKINSYARAALVSCLDVITWLAPEEDARVAPADGLRELLALVQTSFTFRGYTLRDAFGEPPGEVNRSAFRNVVTAALLYASDANAPPAQISVGCDAGASVLTVTFSVQPAAGEPGFSTTPPYRPLTWEDVQALAQPESGVEVQREGAQVRVLLPWALASS